MYRSRNVLKLWGECLNFFHSLQSTLNTLRLKWGSHMEVNVKRAVFEFLLHLLPEPSAGDCTKTGNQ
jgi:hypothetical protein